MYDSKFPVSVGNLVLYRHDQYSAIEAGGNSQAGDVVPAIVVRVWVKETGYVNLKVITDAARDIWVTSVSYSETEPRHWFWRPRPTAILVQSGEGVPAA